MIRVGSVGLGNISKGVHIPGIQASPDLELTAICDIDPKVLKERAEMYGIPEDHCFTDYRELIDCPDVDAVDISVPNHVHAKIAEYAARAGKPYALEKPVTMDRKEALHLYEVTRENAVKNMVCFSYRFKPAARYAKALIESGALGRIYHVNMQYFQAWGLPMMNTALLWRFKKSITGSGALGDLACHAMDLCTFITGEKYAKVCAHLGTFVHERPLLNGEGTGKVDVDDYSNILAETESGAAFSFEITRFAYGRGNYQRLEIYGDRGAMIYHLDREESGVNELEYANEETGRKFVMAEIPEEYKGDQMQSFADILNDCGDGLPATMADGVASQRLMDAVLDSAEKGAWVDVRGYMEV